MTPRINPYILPGLEQTNLKKLSNMQTNVSLELILRKTCQVFRITLAEAKGKSKEGDIPLARHAFCLAATQLTRNKLVYIGATINRNHSTVTHSVKTAQNLLDINHPQFTQQYQQLINLLGV